ncbi:hypothetical protein C8R44DRAFT_729080 [Mycena epipterygia]|nr:hypothetical protein C8R44DRAFT_729080 [Mycena epipterygia]
MDDNLPTDRLALSIRATLSFFKDPDSSYRRCSFNRSFPPPSHMFTAARAEFASSHLIALVIAHQVLHFHESEIILTHSLAEPLIITELDEFQKSFAHSLTSTTNWNGVDLCKYSFLRDPQVIKRGDPSSYTELCLKSSVDIDFRAEQPALNSQSFREDSDMAVIVSHNYLVHR